MKERNPNFPHEENLDSRDPGVDKLRELEATNPDLDPGIYEFARLVSGKIRPGFEMTPSNFFFAIEMTIFDLKKKVDFHTGLPMDTSLTEMPHLLPTLRSSGSFLASVAYGEEFGSEVQKIIDKVTERGIVSPHLN